MDFAGSKKKVSLSKIGEHFKGYQLGWALMISEAGLRSHLDNIGFVLLLIHSSFKYLCALQIHVLLSRITI